MLRPEAGAGDAGLPSRIIFAQTTAADRSARSLGGLLRRPRNGEPHEGDEPQVGGRGRADPPYNLDPGLRYQVVDDNADGDGGYRLHVDPPQVAVAPVGVEQC